MSGRTIPVSRLAPEDRDALLALAPSRTQVGKTGGNFAGEVLMVVIGVAVLCAIPFAPYQESVVKRVGFWGMLLAIGGGLTGFGVKLLRDRFTQGIGTFKLLTGAYYIEADGTNVTYWSLAEFTGKNAVNTLHKNLVSTTTLTCETAGRPLHLSVTGPNDPYIAEFTGAIHRARQARATGQWNTLDGAHLLSRS